MLSTDFRPPLAKLGLSPQEHGGAAALSRESEQGASEVPTASSGASPSQSAPSGQGGATDGEPNTLATASEGLAPREALNTRRRTSQPLGEAAGASPAAAPTSVAAVSTGVVGASAVAHARRRQRDRRAFAEGVLARFWAKLDGTADVEQGRGGPLAPAEQVEVLLRQATSVDALARMYEGWTPWL